MSNAQHSAETYDHGSSPAAVEFGRAVLGGFDCDPCSSGYWDHYLIHARTYYDETQNGLDPQNVWYGRVWLNPPGTVRKDERQQALIRAHGKGQRSVPRLFWDRLIHEYNRGAVDSCVWYGFSLEQLQWLQGAAMHPLQFVTLFPASRLDCLTRGPNNGPPVPQGSPTHSSYLTLLPSRDRATAREQVGTFLQLATRLDSGVTGAVVRAAA